VRLVRAALWFPFPLLLLAAPVVRAEYIVLRSGQRLEVTSYQLLGDTYRLQINGGVVEMAAAEVVSIEPEEVFTPSPVPDTAKTPFRELILAAAARYNVDADLITSVIAAESNFDPKAISRRNARGLMQLLPQTAARLGVQNIFDPSENIDAGTHYLRDLLQRYSNDLALSLAAYNAGPDRVEQYGLRVPPFSETQSYVRRVKRAYDQRKSGVTSAGKTPAKTPRAKTPPTSTSADAAVPVGQF
jgi:soluble lytic murein transglycosylase-like protein